MKYLKKLTKIKAKYWIISVLTFIFSVYAFMGIYLLNYPSESEDSTNSSQWSDEFELSALQSKFERLEEQNDTFKSEIRAELDQLLIEVRESKAQEQVENTTVRVVQGRRSSILVAEIYENQYAAYEFDEAFNLRVSNVIDNNGSVYFSLSPQTLDCYDPHNQGHCDGFGELVTRTAEMVNKYGGIWMINEKNNDFQHIVKFSDLGIEDIWGPAYYHNLTVAQNNLYFSVMDRDGSEKVFAYSVVSGELQEIKPQQP